MMLLFTGLLCWIGSMLAVWPLILLQVLGWVFQFVGHGVYENNRPAFAHNLMHLLVGPAWIVNRVVRVIPELPARLERSG